MPRPRHYCSFKGCKNTNTTVGVHFYRFPKDEPRCQAWVRASKNDKLLGLSAKDLYTKKVLCMNHFEDWCFMNINRKHRLVHNAIPNTKKFLVTRNPVSNNSNDTPVSDKSNDTPVSDKLKDTPASDKLSDTPVSDKLKDTPASDKLNDTPVSDKLNDIPIFDKLIDTPVSIFDKLIDTSVFNKLKDTPVSDANLNDTPISDNLNSTPVSNKVDHQSSVLKQLLLSADQPSAAVSKVHCKIPQFKKTVQGCKRKQNVIPTTFNVPNRPTLITGNKQPRKNYSKSPNRPTLITSNEQQGKSFPKPKSLVLKTLKKNVPLLPKKSSQIIQIIPPLPEKDKAMEQESEVENESVLEEEESNSSKDKSDMLGNKKVGKEKHDSFSGKNAPLELPPSPEVITYLICDVDQRLTDFEKLLPILQDNNVTDSSQKIHIKDASINSNIAQETSLTSKAPEMESGVKIQYFDDRAELMLKISNLEKEIETYRERRIKDQKRIESLWQSHCRKDKKIAALKKCIADLRQQNLASKKQDERIYVYMKT